MLAECEKRQSRQIREQGSVLIVCLGLLAMLALLATAFISVVDLQHKGSKYYRYNGMAQMAAVSGKAHVISVLRNKVSTEVSTVLNTANGWFTTFQPVAEPAVEPVKDLWQFTGIYDIETTDYVGKHGANKIASKWFEPHGCSNPSDYVCAYNRDMTAFSAKEDDSNFPIIQRYAVSIIDLSGTLPVNSFGGENYSSQVDTIMQKGGATAGKFATIYTSNTLTGTKSFSWLHIRAGYAKAGGVAVADGEKIFTLLSPFGLDYFSAYALPGTARPSFNINTCSKKMLELVYQATKDGGAGSLDAATWAQSVIDNRPYTDLDDVITATGVGDEGVMSICNDADGTNDPADETKAFARAFIASNAVNKARFFRVIVRGQIYDKALAKVLSEANLEFVYCIDPNSDGSLADSHVLYQHWVGKTR